ncbi:MAG TPA: ComF family protein [Burkholderiaceae bacterium]|nr:ComF family protein [Burkholderiaceae bacterium]
MIDALGRYLIPRGATRLRRFWNALLPLHCVLCDAPLDGEPPAAMCGACLLALPGGGRRRCPVCARPHAPGWHDGEPHPVCTACRVEPPPFDATLAAADYAPPLDRVITALKFGRQVGLARCLGGLLLTRWAGAGEEPALDCLIPIPLAPERLAQRGFNQAAEIARSLERQARWRAPSEIRPPFPPLWMHAMRRVRDTPRQSSLGLDHRRENLRGCFACTRPVAGLRVGVVDDVMTTGQTLAEAARTLKEAGAAQVVNLVVARTP